MTRMVVALAMGMLLADAGLSQTDAPAGKRRIDVFWSDYKLLLNKLSAGLRELERLWNEKPG